MEDKKILEFLERGILLSPDVTDDLETNQFDTEKDILLVDRKTRDLVNENVDWKAVDEAKVRAEKHDDPGRYERIISLAKDCEFREKPGVKVLFNYVKRSHKYTYNDFVAHFNQRFRTLSGILRQRSELHGTTAIARVSRRRNENVTLIGMVNNKSITKNGNVMFTIEDQSGELRALVTQKHQETFALAKDIVLDEVIGVTGMMGDGILFVNALFFPDVPVTHELKKGPEEEYIAVIGDPQIGGKEFLSKDFAKLIAWFNGRLGNEDQRALAAKVKYVIVIGDLVEGVGVYPGQERDLIIKDIKEQYAEFTRLIKQLPKDLQIICIPGNHDAGRISEPQPPIYKDFAPELYGMENITMLSSPSVVNLGARPGFPGLDVLLYHGYSLIYYADNVPSIRGRGGQKRAELIMKYLLQRRHLAPTHGSNLYIPDPETDPLVISRVPDVFVTGHIHRVSSAVYRGVTLLNTSAWCDITDNQEKRGLEPQPGRLVLMDFQTRDVKVINFYSGKGLGFLEPKGSEKKTSKDGSEGRGAETEMVAAEGGAA